MADEGVTRSKWKEFEGLAIDIIKSQYKHSADSSIIATSYIKDGGFDGSITTRLTKESAFFQHEVLTLLEAKLRKNSVNIHDFAATIIVAYNMAAHALYIVTNKRFTPITQEQIKQYCNKTNMHIELVSGKVVKEWLDNHQSHAAAKYDHVFIEQLRASIDNRAANDAAKKSRRTNSGDYGTVSEPILRNNALTPEPSQVFGKTQQKAINNICDDFMRQRNIQAITGRGGVGKTLVLQQIQHRLEKENYNASIIDMSESSTATVRLIYLAVLKAIWGVDAFLNFSLEELNEYIEFLCGYAGGQRVSQAVRDTVKQIFSTSESGYYSQTDLSNNYLIEFLDQLLTPHHNKIKTIIIFTALNTVSADCLEFLMILIQCLHKHNIGILLELRDASIHSGNGEDAIWYPYYQRFRRLSESGGIHPLEELSESEAYDYLQHLMPGFSEQNCALIVHRVGKVPLFLKHTVHWLKLKKIVQSDENDTYFTLLDIDRFFSGITPESCSAIIDNTIRHYRDTEYSPQNESFLNCIEAAALLDGSLNESVIAILAGSAYLSCAETLLDTSLFTYSKGNIVVSHELVLDRIQKNVQPFRRHAVAELLLENINVLFADKNLCAEKRILLFEVTEKWEELCILAYEYASDMLESGNIHKSAHYFDCAYTGYLQAENKALLPQRLDILFHCLATHLGSNKHGQLAEYQTLLKFESALSLGNKYFTYTAMSYLAEARLNYMEYGAAASLKQAELMFNYLEEHESAIDSAIRDEIYLAYALVSKNHLGLEQAINCLKKKRGDSTLLNIQYYSHCAAKYLNSDPGAAILFYDNVIKYAGESLRFNQNIGHAYVDKLICYFLMEDWTLFEGHLHRAFEYVKNNYLSSELGRLYNVWGLFEWLHNAPDSGEAYLRDSEFLLGQSRANTLLSITKVNLIALLVDKHKWVEASVECQVMVELLLKLELDWYAMLNQSKNFKSSRRYAKLLSLTQSLLRIADHSQLARLRAIIPIDEFDNHIAVLAKGQYPLEVFEGTPLLHSNHIMITG